MKTGGASSPVAGSFYPSWFTTWWLDVATTYDPHKLEFFGTLLVQLVCFWLPSAAYISLHYVFPSFSERHKIQPAPKQPTASEIRHCAAVVFRNQLISVFLGLLHSLASASREASSPAADAPSAVAAAPFPFRVRVDAIPPPPLELVAHLALCVLLREVLFYYSHRLLHSPGLYRAVHKAHHRFTAPVALAAQYAHPAEHLLANTLPAVLPPLLLGAHVLTMWAFLGLTLFETATVHSGYDFFAGAARKHDAHHERFNVNFGVVGLLDWWHGTSGAAAAQRKKAA